MKFKLLTVSALALLSTLNPQPSTAALGTAFTYQGRLADTGSAANGVYDLRFAPYDALSGGTQVGRSLTNAATGVTNGYFTGTLATARPSTNVALRDTTKTFAGTIGQPDVGTMSGGDFTLDGGF